MSAQTEHETDTAERALTRVRVSIIVMWVAAVTAMVVAFFVSQTVQNDRANHRLDRLEQNYLPAKSALRDRQYAQLRAVDCDVLSRATQTARVKGYRAELECPAP